jgi:hypothetical protein
MSPPLALLADVGPGSWASPHGGGVQRCAQLEELAHAVGVVLHPLGPSPDVTNLRRYAAGLLSAASTGWIGRASLRQLRHHGAQWLRFRAARRDHPEARGFLWQDTHANNLTLPFLARRTGLPTLAAPLNLEALVPAQPLSLARRTGRLRTEARVLAMTRTVCCIAREEAWLLATLGIDTAWLPYHPPAPLRATLAAVRARRPAAGGERWLLLGTAENAPTLAGMIQLLDWLREVPLDQRPGVDVAGRGTERLADRADGRAIRVLGEVDPTRLTGLWLSTRGLLVYQAAAAGALTRITDALVAGIPVVANLVAARSAPVAGGVETFAGPADLLARLCRPLPMPAPPERPIAAEVQFQQALLSLGPPRAPGAAPG